MAPELAAAYIIGWIPSLSLTGVHFHLNRKKFRSEPSQTLQKNLRQAGLYWNETNATVQEYREGLEDKDFAASKRSIFLMGIFSFFTSWIGFFFHLIILLSVQTLAVSRLERALMAALSTRDYTLPEVQAAIQDLKERGLL